MGEIIPTSRQHTESDFRADALNEQWLTGHLGIQIPSGSSLAHDRLFRWHGRVS